MLKKRIICTIISILMVLSILPVGVHAAQSQTTNNTEETITIDFCNNMEWENVYIYAFYGTMGEASTGEPLGAYPGIKMYHKGINSFGQKIYTIEIPADVDYIKFSDGTRENNRTDNIEKDEFSDGTLFYLGEKKGPKYWTHYTAETIPNGKIYFENSRNWSKIYAYCYDENGHLLGQWPGTPCKNEGNNIWSVEVTGTPKGIFFNSYPEGVQTNELPFIGYDSVAVLTGANINSYTREAKIMTPEEYEEYKNVPETMGKVYFEDKCGWGNIHAFAYNKNTGEPTLGAWPGTLCKYEGDNIWSIEITDKTAAVLFNNPVSRCQTNDIPFTGFDKIARITGSLSDSHLDAEFFPHTPVTRTGVKIGDEVYDVNIGDTITYEVLVTADKLFEDVQATIHYDSSKLRTESTSYALESGEGTNCPDLNYIVYNSTKENVIKFNASYIYGMDFTEEKVLVTIDFEVIDNTYSEITLDMEEMTIMGDATQSYFADSKPVITTGIAVTERLAPEEETETGIRVDGNIYDVNADSTVTYEVTLKAEELFEDIQAIITYDADKLELLTTRSIEACPGLANGLTYNAKDAGEIKFNAVNLDGYNFAEENILVTLDFRVKDNSLSEINMEICEMTIKGDATQSYFTDGKPVITDGITINEKLITEETDKEAEIVAGGKTYYANAGEKVTYEVWITAEELFEDIQAVVTYDAENLELLPVTAKDSFPGLNSSLIFNAKNPGAVKFVSTNLNGYNFTENGVLVTLTFEVKNTAHSEINLVIEEMTLKGDGTQSYFTDGKPSITKGISVTEILKTENKNAIVYILGDANDDTKINVKDSTLIQKSSAGLSTLEEKALLAADADANEKVNIKDATVIQKHAAGVGVAYAIGTTKVA